jgi:hypothetical protein
VNYDEALETALDLSGDTAAVEAFLATVPAWRDQLNRDVRLAHLAGQELLAISPAPSAAARRQQELVQLVRQLDVAREPTFAPASRGPLAAFVRPPLLAGASLAAAALALAFILGLPALSGDGPARVEAVVIEGSVSEISNGAVTISTAGSAEMIQLSSDTVLTDSFGNTLQASSLNAGQTVVLKGSRSESGVVASAVEVKDRLFGTVIAMTGDVLRLRAGQTEHAIAITSDTEIEGPIRVGSYVEVKVLRLSDGTLRALEIEAEDDDSDGGDDDRKASPGAIPTAVASTPGSTPTAGGAGGGDEDEDGPEVEDEHEDEDSKGGEDEEHQEDREEHDEPEHEDESED